MGENYGVLSTNRHLFIVDEHNSYITINVMHKARDVGVDMLILPSYTSHALQPLDVAVFKPFKTVFQAIRDQSGFQTQVGLFERKSLPLGCHKH